MEVPFFQEAGETLFGVAQYRMGQDQQALQTLTRSEKLNRDAAGQSTPADLAFRSMAQHRLSLKPQALTTFDRLQRRMNPLYPAGAAPKTTDESAEDHALFPGGRGDAFRQGWTPPGNKPETKTP
jgi:hypothetical protein